MNKSSYGIILSFFIILLCFIALVGVLARMLNNPTYIPKEFFQENKIAIRGDIKTKNNYVVSSSKKLYKVSIDTRNINPDKKNLFINLFSIYSGINREFIRKKIDSTFGYITLSYNIDTKTSKHLKELSKKIYPLGILKFYEDKDSGEVFLHGLDIEESGEYRENTANSFLTPVVGYIKKVEDGKITRIEGVKGLEKYYDRYLNEIQDGIIKGQRDVSGNMLLNKDSTIKPKIDGWDLYLNIDSYLQASIENVLSEYKKQFQAKEVLSVVMDSKSGAIVSLATSNRFDPRNIYVEDYPSLNISAIEYSFEPGSVAKVFALATLLEWNKVNINEKVDVSENYYKLYDLIVRDSTKKKDPLTPTDIVVYSSNIGISKLSQRLNSIQIYDGLKKLGFSKKSGIDLDYENIGVIPQTRQLESPVYKATVGYGYGLTANLIQLIKAYNTLINNGVEVTPTIANHMERGNIKREIINTNNHRRVISKRTSEIIKRTLIETVKYGTGSNGNVDGFIVGGKTGTARISEKGVYKREYNSSFLGFVEDSKGKTYTIGVLVRKPKKELGYYASQNASKVFKKIILLMKARGIITAFHSNETIASIK